MDQSAKDGVIVAGAGPVGLTLALTVLRAGIPVTVLEKRSSVNRQSKASTFHASTLDILETLGLLDAMRAGGRVVERVQYRAPDGEILAELAFDLLKGRVRNPYRLHYEQSNLTDLLRDRFVAEGGTLVFEAEVTGIDQAEAGVTALTADGGKYTGLALFGCDGAQSAVRETVRIGYVEKPYPGMALRLYAQTDLRAWLRDLGGIVYLHAGDDTCSLLDMPDCWRIVVRVPDGVGEAQAMSDEWIVARLKHLLPIRDLLPNVGARDVYAARRRRALSAGAGRVYLAGDALHLTNTKGGMNLNAGLHDAYAYARAAVEAVKGADMTPLDRIAFERERVTRNILIPRTDENIGTGGERVARIAALARDRGQATEFLAKQAMLDMLAGIPAGTVGGADG